MSHYHAHDDWPSDAGERYDDVGEGNDEGVVSLFPLPVIAVQPQVQRHPSKGEKTRARSHHNAATVRTK